MGMIEQISSRIKDLMLKSMIFQYFEFIEEMIITMSIATRSNKTRILNHIKTLFFYNKI